MKSKNLKKKKTLGGYTEQYSGENKGLNQLA
jgi:hypothetical protein